MENDKPIASISLGAFRRFRVRDKKKKNIIGDYYLESGSLLTMEKNTPSKKCSEHTIWPMTKKELKNLDHDLRINLTFRVMRTL